MRSQTCVKPSPGLWEADKAYSELVRKITLPASCILQSRREHFQRLGMRVSLTLNGQQRTSPGVMSSNLNGRWCLMLKRCPLQALFQRSHRLSGYFFRNVEVYLRPCFKRILVFTLPSLYNVKKRRSRRLDRYGFCALGLPPGISFGTRLTDMDTADARNGSNQTMQCVGPSRIILP